MEKKFISIKEAREYLGVSNQKLYNLIDEGLPSYLLGKRRFIDRDELIGWVKSHRNYRAEKSLKKKGGERSARGKKETKRRR